MNSSPPSPDASWNDFFFVGGTVPTDAACYVARRADTSLLDHLRRGEFCYVLNTRQMGKSSLMVRTSARLQAEGITVAVLDLTAIGQNLSPEQWYDGLLLQLALRLNLDDEMMDCWDRYERLGPMLRLTLALQQVVLPHIERLVVFVDEIDAIRSLPFPADEFFAAIRECYNRRTIDPEFNKITFCLLGVATPSDLISDARISPFNIGRRIELSDFTAQEALVLAAGLVEADRSLTPDLANLLVERILYWTGGHPYMTQRLCRAIAERIAARASGVAVAAAPTPALVDALAQELFLSKAARSADDNLAFVRNRLLNTGADLGALLDLYLKVRDGRRVKDDEVNPLCRTLRLSGVCRVVQGELKLRNRVYELVFDRAWVRANLPGAELRRQQAAYKRGALRTASVATVVLLLMATLALTAATKANEAQAARRQADRLNAQLNRSNMSLQGALRAQRESNRNLHIALQEASRLRRDAQLQAGKAILAADNARRQTDLANERRKQAENAEREVARQKTEVGRQRTLAADRLSRAYVADGMRLLANQDPGGALASLCEALRMDSGNRQRAAMHRLRIGHALAQMPRLLNVLSTRSPILTAEYSPDGKRFVTATANGIVRVWDAETFAPVSPEMRHPAEAGHVAFSPDGTRLATGCADGSVRIWDASTGRMLIPIKRTDGDVRSIRWSRDGSRIAAAAANETAVWDSATGRDISWTEMGDGNVQDADFSPDGKRLVVASSQYICGSFDVETGLHFVSMTPSLFTAYTAQFSRDGQRMLIGSGSGWGIYDAADAHLLRHETYLGQNATLARFSPDETRIVAAYADQTARVWDTQTGEAITPPLRHHAAIRDARFSADGKRIITCSDDGTAVVWDALTGQALLSPLRHAGPVTAALFARDGQRALTVGKDGLARLWDLTPPRPAALPLVSQPCDLDRFSADYGYVGMRSQANREWRVYDTRTGRLRIVTPPLDPGSGGDNVSFYGAQVLQSRVWTNKIGPRDPLRCWDLHNDQQVPLALPASLYRYLPSPDQHLLANQVADGTTTVYDLRTGRILGGPFPGIPPHEQALCAWYPDSHRLLVVHADGRVWLHDLVTGQAQVTPMQAAPDAIRIGLAANVLTMLTRQRRMILGMIGTNGMPRPLLTVPAQLHGETLSVADDARRQRVVLRPRTFPQSIWFVDIKTGRLRRSPISGALATDDLDAIAALDSLLLRNSHPPTTAWNPHAERHLCAMSVDGRHIATGGGDTQVWICDATTGEAIAPPLPHGSAVEAIAFSPDGTSLVTVTATGAVQVWDAQTGDPVTLPLQQERVYNDHVVVDFLDGGKRIYVNTGDARIWQLPSTDRPTEDLLQLAHILTGQRINTRSDVAAVNAAQIAAEYTRLQQRYPGDFRQPTRPHSREHGTPDTPPQSAPNEPLPASTQADLQREAENAVFSRRWQWAQSLLTTLLTHNPNAAGCLALRARVYAVTGHPTLALSDYDRAVQLRPTDAVSWLERGLLYVQQGHLPEATRDLAHAEQVVNLVVPERLDQMTAPIDTVDRARWEQVIADCSLLLQYNNPQYNNLQYNLYEPLYRRARIIANAALGNWDLLDEDLAPLERQTPGDLEIRYVRIYSQGKRKQWDRVVAAATAEIENGKDDGRFRYLRAVAYTQLKRDAEAVTDETWLLAQQGEQRALRQRRWRALCRLGRYGEAANDYAKLNTDIKATNARLSAAARMALLLLANNDVSGYQRVADEMLALLAHTVDPPLRQLLCDIGSWGPGQPERRNDWRAIAQNNALTGHYEDICTLGVVRYRQGDWADAIHTLLRAIANHPHGGDATTFIALAGAYYHTGQTDQARYWLKRGQNVLQRLLPANITGADDRDTLILLNYRREADQLAGQLVVRSSLSNKRVGTHASHHRSAS